MKVWKLNERLLPTCWSNAYTFFGHPVEHFHIPHQKFLCISLGSYWPCITQTNQLRLLLSNCLPRTFVLLTLSLMKDSPQTVVCLHSSDKYRSIRHNYAINNTFQKDWQLGLLRLFPDKSFVLNHFRTKDFIIQQI